MALYKIQKKRKIKTWRTNCKKGKEKNVNKHLENQVIIKIIVDKLTDYH